MNVKILGTAALAVALGGGAFALAADLADYVTDSTAQPRRDYIESEPATDEDTEAPTDDAGQAAEDTTLDIPAIPPRMPTLENASPVAPSASAKIAARTRAADLPSVAKKRAGPATGITLPSQAAQQGGGAGHARAANYVPSNDGTGSVRRTSGMVNNPPQGYTNVPPQGYANNPRQGYANNPQGRAGGPPAYWPRGQAFAGAPNRTAGQYPAQNGVRRASANGQQPYNGILGSRMLAQTVQPTPAPMLDSAEGEPEPESIEAGEPMQSDEMQGGPMYGDEMSGEGYPGEYGPGCGIEAGCGTESGCGMEGDYGMPEYGDYGDCGVVAACTDGGCGWYGGADYLLLQSRFSDDIAYVREVEFEEDGVFVENERAFSQDFQYESAVRAFFGYRFCDCGGEVQFTYWNYGANSLVGSPTVFDDDVAFFGQFGIAADETGERLIIDSGIDLNVFDIEYARTFPLGDCNSCCPPWLMKYSIGVRIADIKRQTATGLFGEDTTDELDFLEAGYATTDFSGAGPRVGLEGRRYFCGGYASLFARSYFSLLMGNVDTTTARIFGSGEDLSEIDRFVESHTRVIPVSEIEVGGSYQLTCRVNVSAGYLWQTWWDLGGTPAFSSESILADDAGILSFDGLFIRAEMCF